MARGFRSRALAGRPDLHAAARGEVRKLGDVVMEGEAREPGAEHAGKDGCGARLGQRAGAVGIEERGVAEADDLPSATSSPTWSSTSQTGSTTPGDARRSASATLASPLPWEGATATALGGARERVPCGCPPGPVSLLSVPPVSVPTVSVPLQIDASVPSSADFRDTQRRTTGCRTWDLVVRRCSCRRPSKPAPRIVRSGLQLNGSGYAGSSSIRLPNGSSTYHWGLPGTSSVRRVGCPGRREPAQRVDVGHHQRRVGLSGRPEVLLHAQVDLGRPVLEPAPAPGRQLGWLGHPGQPEQSRVERLGLGLGLRAGGHGQLHVVDAHHPVRTRGHGPLPRSARAGPGGGGGRPAPRPGGCAARRGRRSTPRSVPTARGPAAGPATPRAASSAMVAATSRTCSHSTTGRTGRRDVPPPPPTTSMSPPPAKNTTPRWAPSPNSRATARPSPSR